MYSGRPKAARFVFWITSDPFATLDIDNFPQGDNDVLTLVMQSRLKVGDRLATRDAPDDTVPGIRIRDGKLLAISARTRVRIVNFEVLGWIDVEVLRGKRAGDRLRMRPSDLRVLRVRSS